MTAFPDTILGWQILFKKFCPSWQSHNCVLLSVELLGTVSITSNPSHCNLPVWNLSNKLQLEAGNSLRGIWCQKWLFWRCTGNCIARVGVCNVNTQVFKVGNLTKLMTSSKTTSLYYNINYNEWKETVWLFLSYCPRDLHYRKSLKEHAIKKHDRSVLPTGTWEVFCQG